MMKVFPLISPLILHSLFFSLPVNGFSNSAGSLCGASIQDVSLMKSSNHGNGGTSSSFTLSAIPQTVVGLKLTLQGTGNIKGLVLAAKDENGQFLGSFSQLPQGFSIKQDCDSGNSVVQHMNSNLKSLPISFNWSGNGNVTFEGIVVVSLRNWSVIKPLNYMASSGTVSSKSTTRVITVAAPSSQSITTTEAILSTESVTTTEAILSTESVTTTEAILSTESVTTTEAILSTESVTSTESLTTTEIVTVTPSHSSGPIPTAGSLGALTGVAQPLQQL